MDVSQYLEIFLDETNEHLQNLNTQILDYSFLQTKKQFILQKKEKSFGTGTSPLQKNQIYLTTFF